MADQGGPYVPLLPPQPPSSLRDHRPQRPPTRVWAGYAYFAIRTSDAPPPAALGDAPKGASAASFSADEINGHWQVISGAGFVGYRVREILGIVPAPKDAVGRTSAVHGSLDIEDAHLVAAEVSADMTKVRSDEHQRDVMLQENGLETNVYPQGSFRLTVPVALTQAKIGHAIRVTAPRRLTLRDEAPRLARARASPCRAGRADTGRS